MAPVPEAFVPHLCLPPLTLVSALFFYRSLVAILTLATGSSQAPLPTCSFFVEFFLILLLLVVMSFYLRLSVATPHSVATARGVSLFASDLPESSLCLLVCLRVLLGGVILGFSGPGCSSGWLVAVCFPGLGFCQWSERPCACCPGFLAGCSWFLPGGRFPFCWLLSGAPDF